MKEEKKKKKKKKELTFLANDWLPLAKGEKNNFPSSTLLVDQVVRDEDKR